MQKLCENKLDYPADKCGNLTAYEDIQDDVQREVTDYEAQLGLFALFPRLY